MSATARLLGCCVALGLTLSVSSVLAGPHLLDGSTQIGWLAFGQADQSSTTDARHVAEKWLRQARDAMKNGNLELAEYCIERAEKQNVTYDPLFARFKDTPAKVRKDLDEMRAHGWRHEAGLLESAHPALQPGSRVSSRQRIPTGARRHPAARGETGVGVLAANTAGSLTRLPDTAETSGVANPVASGASDERQARSSDLLLGARTGAGQR